MAYCMVLILHWPLGHTQLQRAELKAAEMHIVLCLSCIGLWGILNCKRAELKAAEWHIVFCSICIGLWGVLNCKSAVLKAAKWHVAFRWPHGDLPGYGRIREA